ncbi:hypothetical protein K504DRAFT_456721, partial [Pleomassaria siparia CBS 279.74]
ALAKWASTHLSTNRASVSNDDFHLSVYQVKHTGNPKWLELKAALFEWHMRSQLTRCPVTEHMIQETAKTLWQRLPSCAGKLMPRFSNCYNMDEATLFYGLTPKWTLATGAELEKREEIRLTVTLCCNANGSDKLDPWFISKAKSPRALGGEDNTAIANLPCVYCVEWLRWFNAKIARRRVLLLLDSFSAHKKTVQLLLEEQGGLQNTAYIESLAMALQNIGVIRPAKNLTRFVNLTDEEVIDVDLANLIEHIQAILALETLIRYECSQKKTVYKNYVKPLEGYLSRVSRRVTKDTLSRARQTLIYYYFN